MPSTTKTVEFIAIEPEEQYDTLHYKRDGAEKSGRVYDEYSRTQMVGLKPGADIAVTLTLNEKTKFWNITKVERGTAQDAPKTGGKAPVKAETDWDTIGRQKARCSLIGSACERNAGRTDTKPADIVLEAKVYEAYVFGEVK